MVNEKVTHKQRQERAKLYAHLASKKSLDGLSPKEQRAVFSLVRRARYPWLDFIQQLANGIPDPSLNLPPPHNLVGYEKVDWKQALQAAKEGKLIQETEAAMRAVSMNNEELLNLKRRWVSKGRPPGVTLFEESQQTTTGWTSGAFIAFRWKALRRAHEWAERMIPVLANGGSVDATPPPRERKISWKIVKGKLEELPVGVDPEDEILFDLLQACKRDPFPFGACPICNSIFVRYRKRKYCSDKCTVTSQKASVRGQYMRDRAKDWRQRKAKERKAKAA